jgi:hypothetical protein
MKTVSSITVAETVEGDVNQFEAEEVDFKVVKKRKRLLRLHWCEEPVSHSLS